MASPRTPAPPVTVSALLRATKRALAREELRVAAAQVGGWVVVHSDPIKAAATGDGTVSVPLDPTHLLGVHRTRTTQRLRDLVSDLTLDAQARGDDAAASPRDVAALTAASPRYRAERAADGEGLVVCRRLADGSLQTVSEADEERERERQGDAIAHAADIEAQKSAGEVEYEKVMQAIRELPGGTRVAVLPATDDDAVKSD